MLSNFIVNRSKKTEDRSLLSQNANGSSRREIKRPAIMSMMLGSVPSKDSRLAKSSYYEPLKVWIV
jgi:hypothetical protein